VLPSVGVRRFRNGRLISSANWATPGRWTSVTWEREGCICLDAWIRISPSTADTSPAIEQECLTSGCPRPYPLFAQMSYAEASGSSIYHGLQVKVDRHFAKGLALLAAYTYSKAIDTNSTFLSTNANIPQNSRDLAAEKGLSDFDHRHRMSFATTTICRLATRSGGPEIIQQIISSRVGNCRAY
jgi:hypothetical protein